MLYPCDCRDMKWIVDHHNRYSLIGDHWIETWKEIDRNKKETVIQNLGVKINYCPFCGKKVGVK